MDDAVEFERVAPVIPVRDLDAALDRYRRLGFAVKKAAVDEHYAFLERGSVSMHLTEWHEHDPARSGAVVYLYVSDANALHDEWSRAGVPGQLFDPGEKAYGLLEFGYVDPDGTLHRVGSPLA